MNNFYSNPLSFTSQFTHCALPFRLDSYKGCFYNCIYCYTRQINERFNKNAVIPTNFDIIEKLMRKAFKEKGLNDKTNLETQSLAKRIPVHFGGMSDPFPPQEVKNRITLKILKLLKEFSYPVVLSTKSIMPLRNQYFKLITELPYISLQVSISPHRNQTNGRLELNTPSHNKRIEMLKKFSEVGIHTTCRFQPTFYNLIDSYIYDLINKLSEIGCHHIITEGYKHYSFTGKKTKRLLNDALDMDIQAEMKKVGSKFKGAYMEYPSKYKLNHLKNIAEAIRFSGMTFGSADNDLRLLGDNPCCCGISELPGFENWYKFQFSTAIFKHTSNNQINFDSIKNEWYPKGNISSVINSNSIERRNEKNTIKTIIRSKWNNPDDASSLNRFYNIFPYKKDKNGKFIYKIIRCFSVFQERSWISV